MSTIVFGLTKGGIYALIAVGLVMTYRGSRAINFAQGEIGTFSLYIAWWLITEHHLPWLVGATGAVAVAAAVGWLFEFAVVRRMVGATRVAVSVATIGLALLLLAIEFKAPAWGNSPKSVRAPIGGLGTRIAGVYVTPTQMLSILVPLVIGVGLAVLLRRTDFGLGMLAAAEDPVAVRLVGVPLHRVSAITWAGGGAIAAIAVLLIEPTVTVFTPGDMSRLFLGGLVAALLGGLTSLPGAFVGGLAVGVIEAEVRAKTITSSVPGIPVVALFALVLLVLLVRPQGLLGRVER
jgi:branched-chain amino acid transport system permease protein